MGKGQRRGHDGMLRDRKNQAMGNQTKARKMQCQRDTTRTPTNGNVIHDMTRNGDHDPASKLRRRPAAVRWLAGSLQRGGRARARAVAAVLAAAFAGVLGALVVAHLALDGLPVSSLDCTFKERRDFVRQAGLLSLLWYVLPESEQRRLWEVLSTRSMQSPQRLPAYDSPNPCQEILENDEPVLIQRIKHYYYPNPVTPKYAHDGGGSMGTFSRAPLEGDGCPVANCRFVDDGNKLHAEADLLLWDSTAHGAANGPKWCKRGFPPAVEELMARAQSSARLGQPGESATSLQGPQHMVLVSYEQTAQFPVLYDPRVLRSSSARVNWRRDSDFPISLTCPEQGPEGFRSFFNPPVSLEDKEPHKLVAFVASRCRATERGKYVEELMKHVHVHSFGDCFRNSRIPDRTGERFRDKILELSQFKFVLTFENTNLFQDYISEKLSHTLLARAVPVYWGAPNIDDILPPGSYLNAARDFPDPAQLAAKLLEIDNDDAQYLKFFAWKQQPELPAVQALQAHANRCSTLDTTRCKYCMLAAHVKCMRRRS